MMSETKTPLTLIEEIQVQRIMYIGQRDQMQANLNQIIGAIYNCDFLIKKHQEAEAHKCQDGDKDGEINNEEAQQPAEE